MNQTGNGLKFSDRELQTITHALRVAAERFDEHAKTMREIDNKGLAEQFDRQAKETRELLDALEDLE